MDTYSVNVTRLRFGREKERKKWVKGKEGPPLRLLLAVRLVVRSRLTGWWVGKAGWQVGNLAYLGCLASWLR